MNGLKVVCLLILEIGQFLIMWFTCNKTCLKISYKKDSRDFKQSLLFLINYNKYSF